ncbi:DUF572-domain-containing protein, partial [Aaosphaeria arxii CBS 175.79]
MQGFNMGRYYPPSTDTAPTFNQSSHPLGARARKISSGILTVRFELPFAVWCDTCKPAAIVGQGVRFNAEKKKVGNYYSTPVWSFRMKHTACGGWWEIRTDPKNAEYVVHAGARRREYGDVEKGEGEMAMLTEAERERRREDAFANLEGRVEGKQSERVGRERVEELLDASKVWEDPWTMNQKLRREFRGKRKAAEREDGIKEGIQEKFSLGLEIADEVEGDAARARLVEFGAHDGGDSEAERKPVFAIQRTNVNGAADEKSLSKTKKLKSEIHAEKTRNSLQQSLVGNTRASINPFLDKSKSSSAKVDLGILKRKR